MGSETPSNQASSTEGVIDEAEKAVTHAVNQAIQQQEAALQQTNHLIATGIQAAKNEIDANIQAAETAVQDAVAKTAQVVQQVTEATKPTSPSPDA